MRLAVSKAVYDKDAILAVAHLFSGTFWVKIEEGDNGTFQVFLEPKSQNEKISLVDLENRFMNELIDEQLRRNLEKRYGAIRELIVKHAFSPLENLKAEVKHIVGRD